MKNEEDIELFRKKLEELFSEFYNSKKNVVVSVSYDELFQLNPLNIQFSPPEPKKPPKAEPVPYKILLLPPVS